MTSQDFRQQMRRAMGRHYNLDELLQLAFDLNLDWGELAGATKSSKIISLVEMLVRNGRLPDLLTALQAQHQGVKWPKPSPVEVIVRDVRQGNVPDLSGTTLRRAILNGVDLRGANLRGANLRWASFYLADLRNADLRDADCRGVKMRKANLSQVDLRGARLQGADFRLANLLGAKVSIAQLLQVRKFNGATLPNGQLFDPKRPLLEQLA